MNDSEIVAVLSRQTSHRVAFIPLSTVRLGQAEIASHIARLRNHGVRHIVIDAIDDADLVAIAAAGLGLRVITGSAGLAGALGKVLHDRDTGRTDPEPVPAPVGSTVIFAGSCSQATLGQVERAVQRFPSYRLDPRTVEHTADLYPDASAWLTENLGAIPVLIYSSAAASERGPADPAVPVMLLLKSGNFGKQDLLVRAATVTEL